MESLSFGLCHARAGPIHSDVKTANLHVLVSGFRNQQGIVQITLFNTKQGFPDQVKDAFIARSIPLNANQVEVVFEKIPLGIYAVGAFHDENANKKLDTNFIGLPKEGTGTSNNAKGKMGPPPFDAACFVVDAGNVVVKFNIIYSSK